MKAQGITLLKVGGALLRDLPTLLNALAASEALPAGQSVVVHGAGPQLSAAMEAAGLSPAFVSGRRVTSAREMQLVDGILGGEVNAALVRGLLARGIPAVGLRAFDGGTQIARVLDPSAGSNTGVPDSGNSALLQTLLGAGFLPVLSPVSRDGAGAGVNVNADDCARGLLELLPVTELLMCSDVPGVRDASGRLIGKMSADQIRAAVADGVISGGMVPKVEAALAALAAGCEVVRIGTIASSEDLLQLRRGTTGTLVRAGN